MAISSELRNRQTANRTSAWIEMNSSSSSTSVLKSFLAGSISGTCSTVLFQPLDLVKTRVQSSISTGQKPMRMLVAFQSVVKTESMSQLWRGTAPSLARCVPGIGIYFGSLHWIKKSIGIEKPRMLESALIGATARTIAGIVVLPFTVVKTRFESKEFTYHRMTKALQSIYKTEGIKGLFSGMLPTLLRDVPYSGLYLMFYLKIKHSFPKEMEEDRSYPIMCFISGMVAGLLASLSTQPADVMKTHAQLHPEKFPNFTSVINYIYQNDGLVGFWRGIVPRTVKRTLVAAMSWTVYEELMRKMGLQT